MGLLIAAPFLVKCSEGSTSFSLAPVQDEFSQSSSLEVDNKIDMLFLVDSSGTMATHQENLGNNFDAFISEFINKGFDFNIAVASTDAWVREYNYNAGGCFSNPNPSGNPDTLYRSSADCMMTLATYGELASFRDGDIYGEQDGTPGERSGEYLITSLMHPSDIWSLFMTNVKVGVRGDGREWGLGSLRGTLRLNEDGTRGYGSETHTVLDSFRRDDAFFALIIVSDEDDQSRRTNGTHYSNTDDFVNSFVNLLDTYTNSSPDLRRYHVSTIVIEDEDTCDNLHPQAEQGDRYVALANAVDGIVGDICSDDFSEDLFAISEKIISLSTRFQLSRKPILETIVVTVNGVNVPQDPVNGWVYIEENGLHFVEFRGSAVPAQGASISINFDPMFFGE